MNKSKDRQYPESRAIACLLICHCNYAVIRINTKIKNIIKNAAQSGGGQTADKGKVSGLREWFVTVLLKNLLFFVVDSELNVSK